MKIMQNAGVLLLLFLLTPVLVSAVLNERTLVTSNELEMQGAELRNYFFFRGEVEVRGTNLRIRCDEMTVTAMREGAEDAAIGQIGAIERIVARGNVIIEQAGRVAYAGLAEVDPIAGTVTLSDSPRIVDNDVEVEGFQFLLRQGERKFISVPDPNAPPERPSRSVVRLGALPDLGFDQNEEDIRRANPMLPTVDESADPQEETDE